MTGVTQKQSYSAYGDTVQSASSAQLPGFNGERRDPLTGTTHLGNGYRAYNPTLMRFHAPDSMSPFGAGGLNCYAYCNGDPINNSDPSGHMSAQAGVGIGLGVLGLALGAASFGVSIAAKVAVIASLSAIATGIASIATENSNPEASAALGWASLGLGIASAAAGGVQLASKFTQKNNRKVIREVGTVSRAKEPDSDRMAKALRYIDSSENFEHNIEPGGIISSIDKVNDSHFYNAYTPDEWYFSNNQRASGSPYYASDVAAYQYGRVSRSQGFDGRLPKTIIRQGVTNETTLMKTKDLHGDALFDMFFKNTPNGKSTQRIMDNFSLRADSVTKFEYSIFSSGKTYDFEITIAQ
ncbi:RHS repeat-associated core domain-containing protein [Serratia quinivorans]|uniref:RHS repeat-associated core domain-containing protein n=1 Tax=Serratia quinivorans TaxID=137545 RepID=UPI00217AD75E|nr:RHS repeat-associated core domain-containing protein [Serratia quinivorans]CAI0732461.1 RHS repeat-associated core domain [Serratia quinivorans]CAI1606419.1 RHS repeat-associated core domain [Serratia quinivorans]